MPAKQSLSKDKVPAEGLKQLLSKAFRAGHTTVWEQVTFDSCLASNSCRLCRS